jgi:hypothetical protein
MNQQRPLLADVREELAALLAELRETASARWQLARLELKADLRAAKRLMVAWLVAGLLAAAVVPLAAVNLADTMDGCAGVSRGVWLSILGAGLLLAAGSIGCCAWRRFRRSFIGLRETIEELREDCVWLREAKGEGGQRKGETRHPERAEQPESA